MNDNINFRRLKTIIYDKGFSIKDVAEQIGMTPTNLSAICGGRIQPLTNVIAKLCSVLKCYPSEIVAFYGVVINEKYFSDDKREKLPAESKGELTYKPLWFFLDEYLADVNKDKPKEERKTHNDLFDKIDPPHRINGTFSQEKLKEAAEKSRVARFGENHKSSREKRTDYSKGLPLVTRTKLRNNRPLNLSVIYEICKFLGCSIDFVLGYK